MEVFHLYQAAKPSVEFTLSRLTQPHAAGSTAPPRFKSRQLHQTPWPRV